LEYYKAAAEELLENYDSSVVIAAVLKMLTKEPDTTPVKLTEEQPLPSRRERKPQDRGRRSNDSRNHDSRRNKGQMKPRSGEKRGASEKRGAGKPKPRTYNH
jgi:ATP-dependent RNA helicase DeaD